MGCRCKTLLPVAGTLLQPRYSTEEDTRALMGKKQRQQYYYNQHAKPLQPINQGETVRMKLPGQKTWTPGTCMGQVGPRSYEVKVGESVFRRNRRQLIHADEPPILDIKDHTESESVSPQIEITPQPQQAEPLTRAPNTPVPTAQPAPPGLRRSQRNRKPPARLNDYVPK